MRSRPKEFKDTITTITARILGELMDRQSRPVGSRMSGGVHRLAHEHPGASIEQRSTMRTCPLAGQSVASLVELQLLGHEAEALGRLGRAPVARRVLDMMNVARTNMPIRWYRSASRPPHEDDIDGAVARGHQALEIPRRASRPLSASTADVIETLKPAADGAAVIEVRHRIATLTTPQPSRRLATN